MSLKRALLTGVALATAWGGTCAEDESETGSVRDFVSGTLLVDFESKVLSYGLPDADEPNFLPYGELTFFDVLSGGAKFYFDMTDIGERMGRGDRTWDCWEIDMPVNARYVLTPDVVPWLPTSVATGVGYRYEYHPSRTEIADTQFWVADVALSDLWLVPCLSYERDTVRDNGTYLNFSLSHVFRLMDCLDLTPALSQGWGDRKRVGGYLTEPDMVHSLDRAGLMDSQLRLSLSCRVTSFMTLSGFVAYSDFLFDRGIRDASRNYIRQIDGGDKNSSWCFPVGVSVTLSF